MSPQRLLSLSGKKALNGILRWTSSEYFKMKLQVEMYSFQFAVHLSRYYLRGHLNFLFYEPLSNVLTFDFLIIRLCDLSSSFAIPMQVENF